MKNLLLLVSLFLSFNLFAQKVEDTEYITPPPIENSKVEIIVTNIIANTDWCKMKISIRNKTKGYIVADLSQIGFTYANLGAYKPKMKEVIIKPGKKVSKVIRVKGNAGFNVDAFDLDLTGFSYAAIPTESIAFESLSLEQGEESELDGFTLVIGKVKAKKGKVKANIMATFDGSNDELGLILPTSIKVLDGENDIATTFLPKKAKALRAGKKQKINFSLESKSSDLTLNLATAFKLLALEKFDVAKVRISQTQASVVQKAKEKEKEEDRKHRKEVAKIREKAAAERAAERGPITLPSIPHISTSSSHSSVKSGASGKIQYSSSSTKTVNGRVIEHKSSSGSINVD